MQEPFTFLFGGPPNSIRQFVEPSPDSSGNGGPVAFRSEWTAHGSWYVTVSALRAGLAYPAELNLSPCSQVLLEPFVHKHFESHFNWSLYWVYEICSKERLLQGFGCAAISHPRAVVESRSKAGRRLYRMFLSQNDQLQAVPISGRRSVHFHGSVQCLWDLGYSCCSTCAMLFTPQILPLIDQKARTGASHQGLGAA